MADSSAAPSAPASAAPAGATTAALRSSKTNLAQGRSREKLTGSTQNLADAGAGAAGQAKRLSAIPASPHSDTAGMASGDQQIQLQQQSAMQQRTFENTFKTAPDAKFPTEQVRRLAEEILETKLKGVAYNADKAIELTKALSAEILAAVKKLPLERYKYVVDVNIGEFKGQGIRVASRALWDASTDSYTSASFKNATLFCVVVVFGAYFE
ncbi:hypothetical protein RI367_007829 [Sorochytrium milnesiophthora]